MFKSDTCKNAGLPGLLFPALAEGQQTQNKQYEYAYNTGLCL